MDCMQGHPLIVLQVTLADGLVGRGKTPLCVGNPEIRRHRMLLTTPRQSGTQRMHGCAQGKTYACPPSNLTRSCLTLAKFHNFSGSRLSPSNRTKRSQIPRSSSLSSPILTSARTSSSPCSCAEKREERAVRLTASDLPRACDVRDWLRTSRHPNVPISAHEDAFFWVSLSTDRCTHPARSNFQSFHGHGHVSTHCLFLNILEQAAHWCCSDRYVM